MNSEKLQCKTEKGNKHTKYLKKKKEDRKTSC